MPDRQLFVDIQTIQSLRAADRGIPRFATELSRALLAEGAPVAALALNPLVPWPERIHPDLARAPQLTWNTATAFRRALEGGPLAYVVVSPFELSRPVQAVLGAHVVGVPRVAIVHDLIPHLFPGLFDLHDSALGRVYERRVESIRSFDLVLTPSESTRRDVVEHLGLATDHVVAIGEAASPFFALPEAGERPDELVARMLPAISRPFVLCVSGWEGHKNTEALIEAWAHLPGSLRDTHQLVVVCSIPEEGRRAWAARAATCGLGPDELIMTGFVGDEVLRALYRTAALFVLPSRYEGFGLPVLEAISSGCAAISSNTSSLPEVIGWREATFSPDQPDEIAALVERALTDQPYRAELDRRCAGAGRRHSWPRVVQRLLDAVAALAEPRHRPHRRIRIALVGQFPPSRSWTAGCNVRLAERLAPHCDLHCFAAPFDGHTAQPARGRSFRTFPTAALGPTFTPASYNLVVYAVGSEPDAACDLARWYPGVLWLHDLARADRDFLSGARGVIVDSEQARDLVEQELGPSDETPPTWIIPPHASEAASRILRIAGLDLEPQRPVEAPPVSAPVP